MQVTTTGNLNQQHVYALQDAVAQLPQVKCEYQHHFAPGVYARVMIIPEGTFVVGECHATDHITMLIKGSANLTLDDGTIATITAPYISCTPKGKKKAVLTHEECWFVNVLPTDTEDLKVIHSRVIIPEEVHRKQVAQVPEHAMEVLT